MRDSNDDGGRLKAVRFRLILIWSILFLFLCNFLEINNDKRKMKRKISDLQCTWINQKSLTLWKKNIIIFFLIFIFDDRIDSTEIGFRFCVLLLDWLSFLVHFLDGNYNKRA